MKRGSPAGKGPACREQKGKPRPEEEKRTETRTERITAGREAKLFARAEVRAAFVLYVQTVCYLVHPFVEDIAQCM